MERPGQGMGQNGRAAEVTVTLRSLSKDALIQGALLSYIVVVVPVNSENSHSGVKLVLHMHTNSVVRWCLSRGSMIGILVFYL